MGEFCFKTQLHPPSEEGIAFQETELLWPRPSGQTPSPPLVWAELWQEEEHKHYVAGRVREVPSPAVCSSFLEKAPLWAMDHSVCDQGIQPIFTH